MSNDDIKTEKDKNKSGAANLYQKSYNPRRSGGSLNMSPGTTLLENGDRVDELTDRIDSLSPTKQALLELELARKNARVKGEQKIQRRDDNKFAPLSFSQQRLWFIDQFDPTSCLYNIPVAIRLGGALDIEALRRTLEIIIARHEVLRTNFFAKNGNPLQVIGECPSFTLPVIDLQKLTTQAERESEMRRLLNSEARRPFNLSSDLMLKGTLVRLAHDDHALLLLIHHIAADGWSLGILLDELGVLYKAFSADKSNPLPCLPIQYSDFAMWQRDWLQGELVDRQLSYWKRQLAGSHALLELPHDKPRPTKQSFRGARESFRVPRELTAALKRLSQQEKVTLFMTLLGAFQLLLYRYTGQKDIIVGAPVAGRTRAEDERLIGFFVNTLVLRTEVLGTLNFRQLLSRVREVALGAYTHQDLPFEKLVEELQPARDQSYAPVVQVVIALQNAARRTLDMAGLTVNFLELDSQTAKFDLFLSLREERELLQGSVEYSTDLFEKTTINRMVAHFQNLLQSIVANPERRIADLPILTEAEQGQLLIDWNDTKTDYPRQMCIQELFEIQVRHLPDAVAVVLDQQQLTYRELNERGNQLARYLRQLGVGPDVPVGIFLEPSFEMIVGLLGILKAGGAYVPLDPNYPMERLDFMIQDTRMAFLLTQQTLVERLPEAQIKVLRLDAEWEKIAAEPARDGESGVTTDNLAYISYTSGSTGRPKGVCISHRAVVRLVKNTSYVRLSPKETFLQFASLSFDASTFEIWGCLLNGARLVLLPTRTPSLTELGRAIQRHHITILWLTAGLFHEMVEDHLDSLRCVQQLLAGGDVLSAPHVEKALKSLGTCQLINGYGPTESTTFSCCYPIVNPPKPELSVPIGRPIANTQAYILDRHLAPVPIGVTGELFIGGDGLARGYLNRPELTAESFVPHPFSEKPGERLYKTGDLARYLADGNIEFVGRMDNQVKLRGFRIEVGEIEGTLAQHPRVQQAVVLAREDRPGDKRLVAYVVCDRVRFPARSELRDFVKSKLPEYMVPSQIVFLDAIPLTANGKVDRGSLPAPHGREDEGKGRCVAPRDKVEFRLTKIWEDVLALKVVGVKDDFFELGGHSLLAMRLLARVEKEFNRSVSVATLFRGSTIEKLAATLRGGVMLNWKWLVPLQPVGSKPPLFLLHGSRDLGHQIDGDQPVYGLRPHGLDGRRVPLSVEEMAAEYIEEIRMVQPEGPYFIGGYSFGGLIAFEVARQLKEQGQDIALLLLLDPTIPRYECLSAVSSSSDVKRFSEEVSKHLRRVKLLSVSEARTYVGQTVRWRCDAAKSRVKMLACRALLGVGRQVPLELRQFYYIEMSRQAARQYIPSVYDGRVVLLLTGNDRENSSLYWSRLVAAQLEVYEMPGRHLDVIDGIHVTAWAERLRACLRNARPNAY